MALPLNHGDVESTDECLFVRPKTWKIVDDDFSSDVAFARQMAQMVRFVDEKQAAKLKQVRVLRRLWCVSWMKKWR